MKRLPLVLCVIVLLVCLGMWMRPAPRSGKTAGESPVATTSSRAQEARGGDSRTGSGEPLRTAEDIPAAPFLTRKPDVPLVELKQTDPRVIKSIRSRVAIEPDWAAIRAAREKGAGFLAIDAGEKGRVLMRVDKVIENAGGGYSLVGGISGYSLGTAMATIHEDALVAEIRTMDVATGDFSIVRNPDGIHELREVDYSTMPSCDGLADPGITKTETNSSPKIGMPQAPAPEQDEPETAEPGTSEDDGSVVDVMIVYTSSARMARGGTNAMIASINQAINEGNQAFTASGVSTSFRLAHSEEVTYTENVDALTDLVRLRGKTDGYMDDVHALRDTYAADIVSLWTQSSYAGIGYVMSTLSNSFESAAFNVCDVDYAVSNFTLAHECGHNMGCQHDAENADTQALYSYSYGARWFGSNGTQYRCIMSYPPGTRTPRHSNPNRTYNGGITGSATANNALTLNNSKNTVANWRTEPVSPILSVAPSSLDVPSEGGEFSFAVRAQGSWTWTSSGGAGWLTSSEATSQTGNQTFTYTVGDNPGAARFATITLTRGTTTRTHTILQSGSTIDDHGNSIATATLIGQNSTTPGAIGIPGDVDFFRVDVTTAGTLVVSTVGLTDTFGTLMNSQGSTLATNDDFDTSNFRLSYPVTAGTYYIQVRHYSVGETGPYQLISSLATSPALTADPPTRNFQNTGGSASFQVYSTGSWSWSDNAAWVTSSEAVSQFGDQIFLYTVAANTLTTSRTAVITLTLGGLTATHTITQAGLGSDDHGNIPSTATVVGENSSTAGVLEAARDVDYFRINVGTAGVLVVGTSGSTDTFGQLFNAAGVELSYNDDANGSLNFSIVYSVAPGTYYVRVRHYDEFYGTGAYQFTSSLFEQGTDDHGNNISTATVVNQVSSTTGVFETAGDNDYFRINITGNGILDVRTTGSTDTYGYLLGSGGAPLVTDDNGAAPNFRITRTMTPGTYYVRVRHGSGTGTGLYQLVLSWTSQEPEILVEFPINTNLTSGVSTVPAGTVNIGTRVFQNYLIRNGGVSPLTGVSAIFSGGNAGDFVVTAQPSSTIAAGSSSIFTIRFGPLAAGPRTSVLRIASNDADENPFEILLNGTGVGIPEIAVEYPAGTNLVDGTSSIAFGSVTQGSFVSQIYTIRNLGTDSLNGVAITFNGGTPGDFSVPSPPSTSIPAGESVTYAVRFAPTANGARNTTMRISSNDADENPFDIALSGTGAGAPEIAIEYPAGTSLVSGAASADFGMVGPGQNSSRTFTIVNSGGAPLTGVSAAFTGTSAAEYSLSPAPPSSVAAGATASFTVILAPVDFGNRAATLSITSNDPDESPFTIQLTGGATPRNLYDAAAAAGGLAGANAEPEATPHHDGVKNLLKYAFNMNLGAPGLGILAADTGVSGLPRVVLEGSGNSRILKVEFLRRRNSGLTYQPKRSPSLGSGSFIPMEGTPVVTPINGQWERVVIQEAVDLVTLPRHFAVVEVSIP